MRNGERSRVMWNLSELGKKSLQSRAKTIVNEANVSFTSKMAVFDAGTLQILFIAV
jgi:hypothetical protein